jgi:hypothetical protein
MNKLFPVALAVLTVSSLLSAQQNSTDRVQGPQVSINLPSDFQSENVRINYFMVGPFGGYGGVLKQQRNLHAYQVNASVNGQAAKSVKLIAYVPGCQITTFDLVLSGAANQERELQCRPLPSVSIVGQITSKEAFQGKATEVEIKYVPVWADKFFGLSSGVGVSLPISLAVPDKDGAFKIHIPDLSQDAVVSGSPESERGTFQLLLRESATGKILGALQAADSSAASPGLDIRSSYPSVLQFTAVQEK